MGRAPCCEKVGLNKGLWSAEEDEILRSYIQANGEGSWKSLPKNAGLNRCGKSCRLRWVNYLRSNLVRGNITSEEEDIIIKMYNKIGSRWSVIAGQLPAGRTDNEIKNYWNTYLSRRIYTIKRPLCESSSSQPSVMVDIVKINGCCKRKGRINKRVARNKEKNIHQEIPSNAENKDWSNDLENENAGITLNLSSEEIETISCIRSSPFIYGEPENENLGPYHDLDQSCMLADDDIMSDNLSSPIDILSVNEKENEIVTLSEGPIGLLVGSNGVAAAAAESTGGVSLSSNGAAAEAGESTNEWYIPSCLTSRDRHGVIDEGRNYKLQTDEGDEFLLSWL